jgi:hypothetical protein
MDIKDLSRLKYAGLGSLIGYLLRGSRDTALLYVGLAAIGVGFIASLIVYLRSRASSPEKSA